SLLVYYASHRLSEKYVPQALWLVQHHPEAPIASTFTSGMAPAGGPIYTPADYVLIKAAWEQALIDHADSGAVIYHAGLFFRKPDGVRALRLMEQARQLEPENVAILRSEAQIYQVAFEQRSMSTPTAAQII